MIIGGNYTIDELQTEQLQVETDTLYVNDNKVGIKTTTPSTPLDVVGSINTNADYNISGTQVLSSTTLGSGVVNSSITSIGTLTQLVVTNDLTVDTSTLKVDSANDRVGIVDATPSYPLDVNGNINTTGFILKDSKHHTPIVILQDQKSSGTNGGTFTNGDWRTRDLNTEVADTHNICTLSSNQFTLGAGTYRIEAYAMVYGNVDRHRLRIRNITDSTDAILGYNAYITTTNTNKAVLVGQITIAATKTFELQHRSTNTVSTNGFGIATSLGTEIYAEVEIKRLY